MKMDNTRHLIFVGPSGSGKSGRGREVAEFLELPFCDVDEKLVAFFGKEPTEVFRDPSMGEKVFRVEETRFLYEAVQMDIPHVIVPGAGAIESERNRSAMVTGGEVLWIDPLPQVLIERLRKKTNRPLILDANGNFDEQAVIDRYNKRWPLYGSVAKFHVSLPVEMEKTEVLERILQALGLR